MECAITDEHICGTLLNMVEVHAGVAIMGTTPEQIHVWIVVMYNVKVFKFWPLDSTKVVICPAIGMDGRDKP
jgi:hypothetical protein